MFYTKSSKLETNRSIEVQTDTKHIQGNYKCLSPINTVLYIRIKIK